MERETKNIIIDAENKPLGRVASQVAKYLRGKMSPAFIPNLVPQVIVKVINTSKIKITGKKLEQKTYKKYSGYPGSLKYIPLKKSIEKDQKLFFKNVVKGMLPNNKLRGKILKNLIIDD